MLRRPIRPRNSFLKKTKKNIKKMKFNFDIDHCSNFSSHNGIVFLDGSNPGKFSRQNYENLCYLLDTVGKLSAEVK